MPNNLSSDFTVTSDGVEVTDGLGFAANDLHVFVTHRIGEDDMPIAAVRADGSFDVFRHGYRIEGKVPADKLPAKDGLPKARG